MEVKVEGSIEKAMQILKRKMAQEGVLKDLKKRRFYDKPSIKRKKKRQEARKRRKKEESRRKRKVTRH